MAKTEVDLALRERLFVEHLLGAAQGVAWRALQMAGAKGTQKSLRSMSSAMLHRPSVQAALAEYAARADITREQVLHTLTRQMNGDIADVFDIPDEHDPDGIPVLNLTKAKQLGRTKIIKRLRVKTRKYDGEGGEGEKPFTETTVDVELYDAQGAAAHLAKILGMIIDRKRIERANAGQVPSLEEWVKNLRAAQVPEANWPWFVKEKLRKQVASKVISTKESK